jgi:hypothetical protein
VPGKTFNAGNPRLYGTGTKKSRLGIPQGRRYLGDASVPHPAFAFAQIRVFDPEQTVFPSQCPGDNSWRRLASACAGERAAFYEFPPRQF